MLRVDFLIVLDLLRQLARLELDLHDGDLLALLVRHLVLLTDRRLPESESELVLLVHDAADEGLPVPVPLQSLLPLPECPLGSSQVEPRKVIEQRLSGQLLLDALHFFQIQVLPVSDVRKGAEDVVPRLDGVTDGVLTLLQNVQSLLLDPVGPSEHRARHAVADQVIVQFAQGADALLLVAVVSDPRLEDHLLLTLLEPLHDPILPLQLLLNPVAILEAVLVAAKVLADQVTPDSVLYFLDGLLPRLLEVNAAGPAHPCPLHVAPGHCFDDLQVLLALARAHHFLLLLDLLLTLNDLGAERIASRLSLEYHDGALHFVAPGVLVLESVESKAEVVAIDADQPRFHRLNDFRALVLGELLPVLEVRVQAAAHHYLSDLQRVCARLRRHFGPFLHNVGMDRLNGRVHTIH